MNFLAQRLKIWSIRPTCLDWTYQQYDARPKYDRSDVLLSFLSLSYAWIFIILLFLQRSDDPQFLFPSECVWKLSKLRGLSRLDTLLFLALNKNILESTINRWWIFKKNMRQMVHSLERRNAIWCSNGTYTQCMVISCCPVLLGSTFEMSIFQEAELDAIVRQCLIVSIFRWIIYIYIYTYICILYTHGNRGLHIRWILVMSP